MSGYFILTPPLKIVLRKYSERFRGVYYAYDGFKPSRVAIYFYKSFIQKVYYTRHTCILEEYRERGVEFELEPFDHDEFEPFDPNEFEPFDPDELEPFDFGEGGVETCGATCHLPPVQVKKSVRRFWAKGVRLAAGSTIRAAGARFLLKNDDKDGLAFRLGGERGLLGV